MRVVMVAFLLCALAFVAGVAGDLSLAAQPNTGESVRMHIPPDAIRAHPLPVVGYQTAEIVPVEPVVRRPHHTRHVQRSRRVKPHHYSGKHAAKIDPITALKGANAPSALI